MRKYWEAIKFFLIDYFEREIQKSRDKIYNEQKRVEGITRFVVEENMDVFNRIIEDLQAERRRLVKLIRIYKGLRKD